MAHVQKFTAKQAGHIMAHCDRSATNISNEKIDRNRTALNYNLAQQQQPMKQSDFMKKRLSEIKVQKRDDVNVMCDWVITAPQDVQESHSRLFFESAYNFMAERYGAENVVSAHVHMDETTPHMHFAFIPVVENTGKKGGEKLCAKEAVNRADLRTFHDDLSKHVSQDLGYEVAILNEATKEGNKSIEELKKESAIKKLKELEELDKKREELETFEKWIDERDAKSYKLANDLRDGLDKLKAHTARTAAEEQVLQRHRERAVKEGIKTPLNNRKMTSDDVARSIDAIERANQLRHDEKDNFNL